MNNEHRIVCVGHCCSEYHDMDLEDYKKKVLAVQREKFREWLITMIRLNKDELEEFDKMWK